MPNAAGSVNIVLGMNAVTFTQGIKQAQAELDKFAGKSKQAGHSTVSSMQASSAAVRVFEGGMGNSVRAVERFITTIPGVGAALKVAFPLIGGVAFGAMILETGQKIAAFVKQVDEMPKTIQKGFESLNLSQKTANDALDVTNDKLQNSIDKLEKKPTNDLKLGMDEAKLSADHLAESISGASDKLNELLSKNHINGMQALWGFMGTKSTAGVEGTAKYFNNKVSTASANYAADPSDKNHAVMIAAIKDAYKEASTTAKKETTDRDAPSTTMEKVTGMIMGLVSGGPSGVASAVTAASTAKFRPENNEVIYGSQGAANYYKGLLHTDAATTNNQGLTKQNDADQAKKEAADLAKQQAEAAKAADTARLTAMETQLDKEKLDHAVTIKEEYSFWAARISAFKSGSAAYKSILDKEIALNHAPFAKAREEVAKLKAQAIKDGAEDSTTGPALINQSSKFMQGQAVKDGSERTQGYLDSNQLAMEKASNDAKGKEAQLNDAAGKSMSRYAAATQIANVHAQEYITTQIALQAVLNARKSDAATNPSKENDRAVTAAQKAVDDSKAQRGLQITSDANNITPPSTSLTAGFDDAINDFVNSAKDGAEQMRGLVTNTLNGLNGQLVSAMTGGKTNFKQFGLGVTRNVAGVALQKGEGAIMGAFGGGKLGTKGNPMHVTMEGSKLPSIPGATGKGGSATAGIFGKLFGGKSSDDVDDSDDSDMGFGSGQGGIGSFFGKALGMAAKFLPFLATGGPIDGPAIVGERGPELFMPSSSGRIVPNSQLTTSASSSGSGQNISYSIDARGTDAVQVQQRVQTAIAAAHQSAVKQAVKQVHQQSASQPKRSR